MNENKSIHMSSKEFREYGYSVIDWIADYYDGVEKCGDSARAFGLCALQTIITNF